MSHLDRITVIPDLCNGRPTIRGMRITVATVVGHVAAGDSREAILEAFPILEPDDITASLEYAARLSDHGIISVKTA